MPYSDVKQICNLVISSTNLRLRVSISRLWCCSGSLPITDVKASATTKIKLISLFNSTLRYVNRLQYVAVGFQFAACKWKAGSCSLSFEFAGRTLNSAPMLEK